MIKKNCLRKKTHVNYFEPREPDFDENVFCDVCNDFVFEYCSLHGPLLIIPDDEVPLKSNFPMFVPRAALTIPKEFLHLAPSIIPGAGIGVFSSVTLPKGVRFGPYRGQCTFAVNSSYCWQIYNAKHKPSHVVDALDSTKSNWMRFVNCSRHFSEQNLAAFQYKGELYYRTIRTIPSFTELLVFYGTQFAKVLNINIAMYNSQSFVCAIKFDRPLPKLHKIKNYLAPIDEITPRTYQIPALRKIPKVYELHEDLEGNNFADDFELYTNIDYSENCTDDDSNQSSISHQTDGIEHTSTQADTNYNISNENIDLSKSNIYICNFCNASFQNKIILIEHLKRHKNIPDSKLFTCKDCEYTSVHLSQFQIHFNLHDNKRRCQCKFCGYRFTDSTGLKRHLKKHFRLLQAVKNECLCPLCPNSYATQHNLNSHVLNVHKFFQVRKCDMCDFETTSEYNFLRHKGVHKVRSKTCELCGRTMTGRSFKRHMKLVHKQFAL